MGVRQLLIVSLLFASVGCTSRSSEERRREPETFTVYAVNYPLAYFAERLAPAGVEVVLPVARDVDPAFWRPSPEEIVAFQQADLILLNGAGYAGWTKTATLPKSRTVVTADGCREAYLPAEAEAMHRHGPEGDHSHGAMAFTTWLDFELAACQADHVADALTRALPEAKDHIQTARVALNADLEQLDTELRNVAGPLRDMPLFASHPVYQYLGSAYGLSIRSFHLEPDQALDTDALSKIDAAKEDHDASIMLWEAEPLAGTREALAARGIRVAVFEPAGNRPPRGEWHEVMRRNVETLRCASTKEGCP